MRRTLLSLTLLAAWACSGGRGTGAILPGPPGAGDPIAPPPAGPTTPPPATDPPGATATLVLQGTPEIPDELRGRLEQYLETRSAGLTDISDDGKAILISTRFGSSSQIHLVSRPGGARTQLTFTREPTRGASFVPGSTRAMVFSRDVGGNEQFQLIRHEIGGASTVLTDGKSRNTGAVWAQGGAALAWASNARNGRDIDVWVSDGARPGSAALAVEGSGHWQPIDFSADGKRLLIVEYISIAHSKLHLADLENKSVRTITPEAPAAHRSAVLAPDGKRAYVTSDRDGEFTQLYEVDLARGSWRGLTGNIPWNVVDVAISGDGRSLGFVVNEGGYGRLYLLDTRSRRASRVTGVPEGVVHGIRFARKAPVLGFSFASATSTGDVYTYDLRSRKVVRWTDSEMGGLDSARLIEPTLIEFESFDKLKVPAFYYRPRGDGPFPVTVMIHGGPEAQATPTFSPLTQYLASERGVAVLVPNVRGSDGYGKTYLSLDNGMKREDSVKDIGALLDWIAARKELDARRVAVYGGSYGGYMVLASLVHYGERIVAGVDTVGISSFVTFLENTADYRRDLRRVEYGDERDPEMRAFLERISPLNNVEKIESALFVAQGANDPRVPASEAEQIVEAVRARGHDVWYMLARDEGHGFAKKENRDTFLLLTILFLQRHLLD
jgi:dipeptidyl aminopeptidase/acylaminoacyl peptidase